MLKAITSLLSKKIFIAVGIGIGALLLLVVYALFLDISGSVYLKHYWSVDAISYRDASRMLYAEGGKPHIILSSGYPLILGIPSLIIGDFSDHTLLCFGIIENLIFYFFSFILLYYIIDHYTNQIYSAISCIVLYFFVGYTALLTETLAEIFFVFLLLLSMRLYQLSYTKTYQFLFYFVLGWLLITKPIASYPALIITAISFIKSIYNSVKFKKNVLNFFGMIPIVFYILQAIWVHQFYPMYSYNCVGKKTMYAYLLARSQSFETGEDFSSIKNERNKILYSTPSELFPKVTDSLLKTELDKQMPDNASNIIKALFYHIFAPNMQDGSYNISQIETDLTFQDNLKTTLFNISKGENIIYTILLCILFLYHSVLFIRRRKWDDIFVLSMISMFFIGMSGISCFQGDRLHIVVLPFLLIILSTTLYKLKTNAR